jgi:hypothetical protein
MDKYWIQRVWVQLSHKEGKDSEQSLYLHVLKNAFVALPDQ